MIKYRPEKDNDCTAIFETNELAFPEDNEARLVDMLRESESYVDGLSIVAEKDGEIVGHILFTKLTIASSEGKFTALSLAPIAVKPNFQRQGIGSGLIKEGIKACKSLGYGAIVVVGHPEYYPRFGFSPAREKGLETPFPVPDEAFMVYEIVPGYLDNINGMIKLAPEFDEFI
jgi:putative acetyltransferase